MKERERERMFLLNSRSIYLTGGPVFKFSKCKFRWASGKLMSTNNLYQKKNLALKFKIYQLF